MGVSIGDPIEFVFALLSFCIQIISGAAYLNMFESDGEVKTGYSPSSDYGRFGNSTYYANFSMLAFGLISLFFAVVEFFIMIAGCWAKGREVFKVFDSMILRGIVYVVKGIATLGASGDLGIAAGAMEMIVGAAMIIYALVTGCCNKGGKK